MKQFYTYLHCKPNGDPFYVGKGCRWRSHDFKRRNPHHQNIVEKYGKENIEVLVFPRATNQSAIDTEIEWIKVLREAGFELANKTDGGEGTSGRIYSDETRKKMSSSRKGRIISPETCAKISANNKSGTPEVRAKKSATMTGKKRPPEVGRKISAALKGRAGKKHSDETRAKMSASAMRRYRSQTEQKLVAIGSA